MRWYRYKCNGNKLNGTESDVVGTSATGKVHCRASTAARISVSFDLNTKVSCLYERKRRKSTLKHIIQCAESRCSCPYVVVERYETASTVGVVVRKRSTMVSLDAALWRHHTRIPLPNRCSIPLDWMDRLYDASNTAMLPASISCMTHWLVDVLYSACL